MANIRVDPSILDQSANNVKGSAQEVNQAGNSASGAASSAPSYDGQFGPRIWSIGREAQSRGLNETNRLNDLSGQLFARSSAFESADTQGAYGLTTLSPGGSPGTDKLDLLLQLSILTQIPISELKKYIQLGMFINPMMTLPMLGGAYIFEQELERKTFIGQENGFWQDLWNNWDLNVDISHLGKQNILWPPGQKPSKDELDKPEFHIPLWSDEVWGIDAEGSGHIGGLRTGWAGSVDVAKGEAGIGIGMGVAGAYADFTGAEASGSVDLGDKNFGVGLGGKVDVLDGEAFIGYKDGEVGAKIGGDLVSVEGKAGVNILGKNVGVTVGAGVGFELGLEVGEKTEIDLGPFKLGFDIGDALGS